MNDLHSSALDQTGKSPTFSYSQKAMKWLVVMGVLIHWVASFVAIRHRWGAMPDHATPVIFLILYPFPCISMFASWERTPSSPFIVLMTYILVSLSESMSLLHC